MARSAAAADEHDEWVLDRIADRTEPDPESAQTPASEGCTLWTGSGRLLQDAQKRSTDVDRGAIEDAIDRLRERRDVFYWAGYVTLATEEYLRAVIESERNSNFPRTILIGRVNRYLSAMDVDGGDRSGD